MRTYNGYIVRYFGDWVVVFNSQRKPEARFYGLDKGWDDAMEYIAGATGRPVEVEE